MRIGSFFGNANDTSFTHKDCSEVRKNLDLVCARYFGPCLVEIFGRQANLSRSLDQELLALFAGHGVAVLVGHLTAHLAGNVLANDLEERTFFV